MDASTFHEASGNLDARITAALAKLALVGRRALDHQAATRSLSAIQSLVLDGLARRGPAQVGVLASRLAVTPPTISDSVAALERKGLVCRAAVAKDARGVEVRLTPRGRKVANQQSQWPDLFRHAVEELAPTDKSVLLRLLLRIIAELVEGGIVHEARICVTCEHFRPNAHPGSAQPHHCALVNLPLSDEHLRVDCPDHVAVAPTLVPTRLRELRGTA